MTRRTLLATAPLPLGPALVYAVTLNPAWLAPTTIATLAWLTAAWIDERKH